jgi:integrase
MSKQPTRPTGVIKRDAHLQIDLRPYGYGRERLELQPTPANINYAARLRIEILGKIERGTFSLAEYFPDSPRVARDNASLTWKQLGDEWLATKKTDIQHSTYADYKKLLASKHFADWRPLMLPAIDYRKLMAKVGALPVHPKTFNNLASVLRMQLEYAHNAKLIREPLHEKIEFRKNGRPDPDPFTIEEIEIILTSMRPEGVNYYEFAFFSGVRPSEGIALQWPHCDVRTGRVKIQEAITRGQRKGTKTGEPRILELNKRARAALERQRAVTQLAGTAVFLARDGESYTSTDGPLDAFWKAALKKSGIRYRDARQTRHTFATMCLHAGRKPGWIAAQLGHSVEMFYRVYSKWIEAQDRGAERDELDRWLEEQQNRDTDRDANSQIG